MKSFRPLAPSILHEDGADWFVNYADSPYMTQTFTATEEASRVVPAIVHADGTSRLQSVHDDSNGLYAELLRHCKSQAGLPMLLNTSLNAYNDPMACEPHQALRTFFTTGLDSLILGDFVIDKQ